MKNRHHMTNIKGKEKIYYQILKYRKKQKKFIFNDEMNERLNQLNNMVNNLVVEMPEQIKKNAPHINVLDKRDERNDIDNFIEKLNLLHLKDIKKGIYKYKLLIISYDIFNEIETIGNHSYHCLKYIDELNN